jgi:hypothetical protein
MTDKTTTLLQKLRCARFSRDDSISLTHEELLVLLDMLPAPRKHDPKPARRDKVIATLFALYKAKRIRTKAVIDKLKGLFGVSKQTIFEARRKHPMDLSRMSVEKRAQLIANYESRKFD